MKAWILRRRAPIAMAPIEIQESNAVVQVGQNVAPTKDRGSA
jgi:hypothetical protein